MEYQVKELSISNEKMTAIVIGGSGFVGKHLVEYINKQNTYSTIIVADLMATEYSPEGTIYIPIDVRKYIDPTPFLPYTQDSKTIFYYLAGLCRIPGYADRDYFETNIRGAENTCKLAEELGCQDIVFTSTVATYGVDEDEKNEDTIPMPSNPYGISKLVAEEIHKTWHAKDPTHRNLPILRPGIIFGKGEGANFSRLYKAIAGKYFFYPGRRDTLKACIYVKDVVEICYHFAQNRRGISLFNLTYPTPYCIEEICRSISKVTGHANPWLTVPSWLLLAVSTALYTVTKLFGRQNISLHPDRVRKLMVSTNISGKALVEKARYKLRYSLDKALEDWYQDNNRKGLL